MRHGGSVVDCAVLVAVGINENNRRTVLGVSVALSEAEVHWREFMEGLCQRGLHGVEAITSDAHSCLRAALKSVFPSVPWQRCQFHLQQNAQAYVPHVGLRKEVAADIRSVFNAPSKIEAERLLEMAVDKYAQKPQNWQTGWRRTYPRGLTVFALPKAHQRRLRTSNTLERLNKEVKRRHTCRMPLPEHRVSLAPCCLRSHGDQRGLESGRIYLNMDTE